MEHLETFSEVTGRLNKSEKTLLEFWRPMNKSEDFVSCPNISSVVKSIKLFCIGKLFKAKEQTTQYLSGRYMTELAKILQKHLQWQKQKTKAKLQQR